MCQQISFLLLNELKIIFFKKYEEKLFKHRIVYDSKYKKCIFLLQLASMHAIT
jgi:hypothetical protein